MTGSSTDGGRTLIEAVRSALASAADPARATSMQAYMKSAMPFYGIPAPVLRRLCRDVFAAHPLDSVDIWQSTVLALWREAAHREERYAAIELTGARRYRAHQTLATLPMYEEMVVSGAWWDFVDAIAPHRIGAYLLRDYREPITAVVLEWSRSADLWKRRAAIICQLGFKERTDLELLYASIEPNLDHRNFFIRKAIGWALRAYAWTDPDEIGRYVREHDSRLSGLSRREALKNIGRLTHAKA
ncbi:MAG: DNA alkylation repair protein [Dehalococcoidia bacterium]